MEINHMKFIQIYLLGVRILYNDSIPGGVRI